LGEIDTIMELQESPDVQIQLGWLDEFDTIEDIKSICPDMYKIEKFTISDSLKHYMDINVTDDKQVWMLKYGNHAKIGTRKDKDYSTSNI